MFQIRVYLLINIIIFIYFNPFVKSSKSKNNANFSEFSHNPKKPSHIKLTFMENIGNQNFFEYSNIDKCFKNYDYNNNFDYNNPCFIKNEDIIEFTFKKEFKNLDSFFSNNKSQQVEYLLSVDLSGFVQMIKNITSMNYMFKGCKNLKYINFGKFDASKVTSMISMFEGCSSLISINLSNFDTSNVIDMSGIFNNLISLKVLDISNFNMENAIKYNNMFNNLPKLRYINIYNFKNEKNKIVNNAFKDNNTLILCQKEKIISNPNAVYKCCNFNIEKDSCDIITSLQNIFSHFREFDSENRRDIKMLKQKMNLKSRRRIESKEKIKVIFLGINLNWILIDNILLFDYYYATINNNIDLNLLNFSFNIEYDYSVEGEISTLVKYADCKSENNEINNKLIIHCSSQFNGLSNINISNFHSSETEQFSKLNVMGAAPTKYFITHNVNFFELLNSLNQKIYILEHSILHVKKSENKFFNISGIINENDINIINSDLIFYANNYNMLSIEKFTCSIINENKNNYYTLNCKKDEKSHIDLQSSISLINDKSDMLLINFDRTINNCSGKDFINHSCTPEKENDIIVSDYINEISEDIEKGEFNEIFDKVISENKTYNGTENNVTYTISTISKQYSTKYSTVALEDCESRLKKNIP